MFARRRRRGRLRVVIRRRDEALHVDALARHAALAQRVLHRIHEGGRAAQVEILIQGAADAGVHVRHAHEAALVVQRVVQGQAARVLLRQAFELVAEDDRARVAVGVEELHATRRGGERDLISEMQGVMPLPPLQKKSPRAAAGSSTK